MKTCSRNLPSKWEDSWCSLFTLQKDNRKVSSYVFKEIPFWESLSGKDGQSQETIGSEGMGSIIRSSMFCDGLVSFQWLMRYTRFPFFAIGNATGNGVYCAWYFLSFCIYPLLYHWFALSLCGKERAYVSPALLSL